MAPGGSERVTGQVMVAVAMRSARAHRKALTAAATAAAAAVAVAAMTMPAKTQGAKMRRQVVGTLLSRGCQRWRLADAEWVSHLLALTP